MGSQVHSKFVIETDDLFDECENFLSLPPEDLTESLVETKLQSLEEDWKSVRAAYEAVYSMDDNITSAEFKNLAKIRFRECKDKYQMTKANMMDLLKAAKGSSNTDLNGTSFHHMNTTFDMSDIGIKVPPCDTQDFHGSYEEWPAFRDMFSAIYGNHPRLTQAQKLYHLRNKTKGEANRIVKKYPLSDQNFLLAWDALKARYENKRVLVDNQLKTLFDIPVSDTETSGAINRIRTTICDCVALLRTHGVQVDQWDPILIYLCSTRLPVETLTVWEQSLESHSNLPTWAQMDAFLDNRHRVIERISSLRRQEPRSSVVSDDNAGPRDNDNNRANKARKNRSGNRTVVCGLCNESHNLRLCTKFSDFSVKQRIDYVERNNICSNCLSPTHKNPECKSIFRCTQCKGKHHSLLHVNPNNNRKANAARNQTVNSFHTESTRTAADQVPDINDRLDQPCYSGSAAHATNVQTHLSDNHDDILLPTALVQILHLGEKFTVRALIDSASKRTFLTDRIQKRLNLKSKTANFEICGLGGTIVANSDRLCDITLCADRNDFKHHTQAVIVPNLTSLMPSFTVSNPDLTEISDLDLADPTFLVSSQIDMLLGSDVIPYILQNGTRKNVLGNMVAQNSIYGWYIYGPFKTSVDTISRRTKENSICSQLGKFWEWGEVSTTPVQSEDLLSHVPPENVLNTDFLKFDDSSATKTLGMRSNALSDTFTYKVEPIGSAEKVIKRQILSSVPKLFDPAGWLTPIIIKAKMLRQELWQDGVDWDESVNPQSLTKWNSFVENFPYIESIKIPRWINFHPENLIQMHEFCDASELAYCAALYLRSRDLNGISSHVLVAKGKVAPLQKLSLPRLELCGAVLLSKLVKHVVSSLSLQSAPLYLWTDSTIVLAWLQKHPSTWKTYVASRTTTIFENVGNAGWKHVSTNDNPADLGTRGCKPQDLVDDPLWWFGPIWLLDAQEHWPQLNPPSPAPLEQRRKIEVHCTLGVDSTSPSGAQEPTRVHRTIGDDSYPPSKYQLARRENETGEEFYLLNSFTSYRTALAAIAYMFRFKLLTLQRTRGIPDFPSATPSHDESNFAKVLLIKLTQKAYYGREYDDLLNSRPISKKSSLLTLNPFLGPQGILRVNGRLANADLTYDERFPVIVPTSSNFCEMLLKFMHKTLMHADISLMMNMVRCQFYIPYLKRAVRKCINFEECSTLLGRIETVLKSRPLSPINGAPDDLQVLTPGHFLRGGPIMLTTESPAEDTNISLLSRWEKLKALHHKFPRRLKTECLQKVHKRYKWQHPERALQTEDFVLVTDELLPPNEWRLGHIKAVHRGSDDQVRVADQSTQAGVITRPIVKLCWLPVSDKKPVM